MTETNKTAASERPLSPHLTIYRPQITSVLSISHRASGFFLYIGALLLSAWLAMNIYGCGKCINGFVVSFGGKILLFLWSLALYYHLCNGIRHLFWDFGKGYEISTVTKSGVAVIVISVLLTAATWWYLG